VPYHKSTDYKLTAVNYYLVGGVIRKGINRLNEFLHLKLFKFWSIET
jgi:hypothetical protein